MRVLLQRVTSGQVSVGGQVIGSIGPGYVLLVGITASDGPAEVEKLAQKVVHLRVFNDEAGKMNRSALDVGAEILVISQFTLYANARKGRRPSYTEAAPPAHAEPLVQAFAKRLQALGVGQVALGEFGADMLVEINNDGPVTIWLDSEQL
jgi:D-tyrosyl-tRNA(Tyr) deacylase